ncbi:hypothetical protein [Polaromonas sp. UC242_47]|uniref:hypothetical protein n=1 Tax=Polaromonas sp. UC242_47 TaxID=3374626 RepID=UPI0037A2B416
MCVSHHLQPEPVRRQRQQPRAALLTGQPQSLKARLGTVGLREASAPPPDEKMPRAAAGAPASLPN